MSYIELKVPYQEKDHVKSLGARWDPIKKIWYVPSGVDPKLFTKWLNLANLDKSCDLLSDNSIGYSLNEYLLKISAAVASIGTTNQWVRAEISYLSQPKNGHYYLEITEHNETGVLIAKATAVLWQRNAESLLNKFLNITGSPIQVGMKILFLVTTNYDSLHGLKLSINDIDPAYTLGEMKAKLIEIRKRLKDANLYDNNRKLTLPTEFTRVAVISPKYGAGLSDFQKEANVLEQHSLCKFQYFYSQFQGINAYKELIDTLKTVEHHHTTNPFDVLVIIRGGGAITDLSWLNNFELASIICQLPLPVFTGIGHQKDSTIIDEVACCRFDTPSKVSAFIITSICNNAKKADADINKILHSIKQNILLTEDSIENRYLLLLQNILGKYNYTNTKLDDNIILIKHLANVSLSNWQIRYQQLYEWLYNQFNFLINNVQKTINYYWGLQLDKSIYRHINFISENYQTLYNAIQDKVITSTLNIEEKIEQLIKEVIGISPNETLKRGFTLVRQENGHLITRLKEVKTDEYLKLQFYDGELFIKPLLLNMEKDHDKKSK